MRAVRSIVLTSFALALVLMSWGQASSASDPLPQDSQAGPTPSPTPASQPAKHPKLAYSLVQLIEASQRLPHGSRVTDDNVFAVKPAVGSLLRAGLLRLDSEGRVQVVVHVSRSYQRVLDELESNGAVVERWSESGTEVQVRVAVKTLAKLAGLEDVAAVAPPRYGRVSVGSRLT